MVESNKVPVLEYYVHQTSIPKTRDIEAYYVQINSLTGKNTFRVSPFTNIGFAYRFYLASQMPLYCNCIVRNPELAEEPYMKMQTGYEFPLLTYLGDYDDSVVKICRELYEDFDPATKEITDQCMEDVLKIYEILYGRQTDAIIIKAYKDVSMIPVFQAITSYLEKNKQKTDSENLQ